MYSVGLSEDRVRYAVLDENNNIIATYKYKLKARHHVDALNNNEEYIEKPNSYYDELGLTP